MVLTKFRINVVGLFTGYAAIAVYRSITPDHGVTAGSILLTMLALLMTGGAANTCNQIIEVNRDKNMSRTVDKRPLPSGRMTIRFAVMLAIAQQALATWLFIGPLESPWGLAMSWVTVIYYAIFYTMYLKPRHYLNIVIGGVPGAMGPIMAWAAVANAISWEAFAMFMIIFLWTPPHFWALAIRLKDDYAKAGIPMLPVVKGVDETSRQIFIYTVVMVSAPWPCRSVRCLPHGALLYHHGSIDWRFLVPAWCLALVEASSDAQPTMPLFHYSIIYVGLLYSGMIADALMNTEGK